MPKHQTNRWTVVCCDSAFIIVQVARGWVRKKAISHCIHVLHWCYNSSESAVNVVRQYVSERGMDRQTDGWMVRRKWGARERGTHLVWWTAHRMCGNSANQAGTCPAGSRPPPSRHSRCSIPGHLGARVHVCLGHGAPRSRPNLLSVLSTIDESTCECKGLHLKLFALNQFMYNISMKNTDLTT